MQWELLESDFQLKIKSLSQRWFLLKFQPVILQIRVNHVRVLQMAFIWRCIFKVEGVICFRVNFLELWQKRDVKSDFPAVKYPTHPYLFLACDTISSLTSTPTMSTWGWLRPLPPLFGPVEVSDAPATAVGFNNATVTSPAPHPTSRISSLSRQFSSTANSPNTASMSRRCSQLAHSYKLALCIFGEWRGPLSAPLFL